LGVRQGERVMVDKVGPSLPSFRFSLLLLFRSHVFALETMDSEVQ